VILRDAQNFGDALTGALFEQAQRDDRALDFAEFGDAGAEPHGVFGAYEEFLLQLVAFVGDVARLELDVRARAKVTAPLVARSVAHDRHEHGRGTCAGIDLARLHEIEERDERVLDAINRFLGREPFVTRHGGESPTFLVRNTRKLVEYVVARRRRVRAWLQ